MFARFKRFIRSNLVDAGVGLIAMGASDALLEDNPEATCTSSAIALAGLGVMAVGTYLEREEAALVPAPVLNAMQKMLCEIGRHCKSIGIVVGSTHLIKRAGSDFAASSILVTGLFMPDSAKLELLAPYDPHFNIRWEKLRFCLLALGDSLTASSVMKLVNGDDMDTLTRVSMSIGFALFLGETIFMCKKDIWENIQAGGNGWKTLFRALNRRGITLQITLGTFLGIQDFMEGRTDGYAIESNAYMTVVNVFLLASLVEIYRQAHTQALSAPAVQHAEREYQRLEEGQQVIQIKTASAVDEPRVTASRLQ